ncbi:glutamyl aminopeptidase-like [Anoplolepis gracilipes]|uniref:glutamyl aminopeptidase-like n=1 Tax=Anoplolepis gracilipes TaxID=354296 RepID=UPI003BA1CAD3
MQDNCYRYLKIEMAFLRLLLYGELIFLITAKSVPVDEYTKKSAIYFNDYFDSIMSVSNYNVQLKLYSKQYINIDEQYINIDEIYKKYKIEINNLRANSRFVYGEMHVDFTIFYVFSILSFHSARSIEYLFGELIYKITGFSQIFVGENFYCDTVTEICTLHLDKELSSGNYTLHIEYLNAINNTENILDSLESVHTNSLKLLTWSGGEHFQAIGARQLFPCWDNPRIKSTFNISIKHHYNYTVLSNMPIEKEITEAHMKWTFFEVTPEMPIYLVTVAISPEKLVYDKYETDEVIVWHRPELQHELKFARMVANETMTLFQWKWKNLSISPVQFVAIYGLPYNNKSWGLVLNRYENLHSAAHKIKVARLIAHETAHQWFSNLINPFYSSYSYLIDGLTTLFGMDAINSIEGYNNSEMLDLFVVQFQYESFRLVNYSFHQSFLTEVNPYEINAFSIISHYKVPLILRMLQHLITNEVFAKSIYRYLNNHFYKHSIIDSSDPSDDFWTVMQITVNESYPEFVKKDVLNLRRIFDDFTSSTNYLVLKIARNYSQNSVNITIKNYDILKYNYYRIPVTYTTQNNSNFENRTSPIDNDRLILMSSIIPTQQIFIKDDGWVMFNLQQAGYYRVNYDVKNWQKIAEYLNSTEYTNVHVLNRAKIIEDAFHFMITHQLNSSIFWNLTSYFTRETKYIAWYPMIKALEYMSKIFPFPDEKVQNIKDNLKTVLKDLLRKIEYEDHSMDNDLTKCLRQEAIKWACLLGDFNCQNIAIYKLMKYITKMETKNLLPWWKQWTFCKGLMTANLGFWNTVKNNLEKHFVEHYNRIAEFLACAPNKIMDEYWKDEYLQLIKLEHNKTHNQIRIKSYINSFLFIIAKYAQHNMLSEILSNVKESKPRDVSMASIFIVIVNHVYSEKQLHKITIILKTSVITEAYIILTKNNIDRSYKENVTFFNSVIVEESVPNFLQKWMSYIDQKIQIRLSQIREIETQIRIF